MDFKLALFLMFILGIGFVSSFDPQLPQCHGLDDELIICSFDSELVFLSGELPEEGSGTGGGVGVDYLTTNKTLEEFPQKVSGLGKMDSKIKFGFLFLSGLVLFMIYKRRKKKKEKEKLEIVN